MILASAVLADAYQHCRIYNTEHGSDHSAIDTLFDVDTPNMEQIARPLFKNAPWKEINARVANELRRIPRPIGTQEQADRLLGTVEDAVKALTPLAKPSPYTKRWWTEDLTQLRNAYTKLRNRTRSQRRTGLANSQLEDEPRGAAKTYHSALRKQKKAHWEDFLAEETNIWSAARFTKPEKALAFSKIPPLKRADGSSTTGKDEKANELLQAFFRTLPARIDEEGDREQRPEVPMPELEPVEIERKISEANSWKAAGIDGLPAVVWKRLWPTVENDVTTLFRSSLKEGYLPQQWRQAKIIPLRKPGKPDYAVAKAWRPISLLSTLGKRVEAVLAERISYLSENYNLLPQNHYGARRRRSAEQALLLLQDKIYNAWRSKLVVSLLSFDVKGAYNGVLKERLCQRLSARGIPKPLINWVMAFCSNRSASILVNYQESGIEALRNPGLPQGSPLSPILFLFYNADLVQQAINSKGGSIAFVDDYTAWVVGKSATANQAELKKIIKRAEQWERRSGATFEGDKTAFIHFTRTASRANNDPLYIKGREIEPSKTVKLLGILFDSQLRFREHVARATSRGLKAVLVLGRMTALLPSTARQLFKATVAPVVDYASCIWAQVSAASAKAFNTIQKIAAKAVTGAFRTVAREVAEAEATLLPVKKSHAVRAATTWINLSTLPKSNPLRVYKIRHHQRFASPLLTLKMMANLV